MRGDLNGDLNTERGDGNSRECRETFPGVLTGVAVSVWVDRILSLFVGVIVEEEARDGSGRDPGGGARGAAG